MEDIKKFNSINESGDLVGAIRFERKLLNAIKTLNVSGDPLAEFLGSFGSAAFQHAMKNKKFCHQKAIKYFADARDARVQYDIDPEHGLCHYEANLIAVYFEFDRFDEGRKILLEDAIPRTKEIKGEGYDGYCLAFLHFMKELSSKKKQYEHVYEITLATIDDIEACWTIENQLLLYSMMSDACQEVGELHVHIEYKQKMYDCAQVLGKTYSMALHLQDVGAIHNLMGDFGVALDCLKRCLTIRKDLDDKEAETYQVCILETYNIIAKIFRKCGSGNEQSAIKVYRKILKEIPACKIGKMRLHYTVNTYRYLGVAYFDLGEWDIAIQNFKKSLEFCTHDETRRKDDRRARAELYLGNCYLEKYRTMPRSDVDDDDSSKERAEMLNKAFVHINNLDGYMRKGAVLEPGEKIHSIYNVTKIICLSGENGKDYAKEYLERLFDDELKRWDKEYVFCHYCGQRHGKTVELLMCSGCQLKCYCNKRHQKLAFKNRLMGHQMVCPYLNRWRKVKKRIKSGKKLTTTTSDSCELIIEDFFQMIFRMYPK